MNHDAWNSLLTELNRACLDIIPHVLASPPPHLGMSQLIQRHPDTAIAQVAASVLSGQARWLGMPPATAQTIRAVEVRLGVQFPASYRSFLQVSNGFLIPGEAISSFLPVELIRPFGEDHVELARYWRDALGENKPINHAQSRLEYTIQLSGPPNGRPEFVLLDPDLDEAIGELEVLELVHEGPDYVEGFDSVMRGALHSVKYGLHLHTQKR